MGILYVGIDLAKNVFAVHGVNRAGKPELVRPAVPRARLHELIATLPRARWRWKPAPAATTGPGCLPPAATPFA